MGTKMLFITFVIRENHKNPFRNHAAEMRYAKSNLCQLGWISCMGCCGKEIKDKLSVAKGIEKNTLEFDSHNRQGRHKREFMNRSKDLRESGICKNLVYDTDKDRIYCPLHPELNDGIDHRIDHNHCDIMHVCKAAYFFDLWEKQMKEDFVKFIRHKKKEGMSWYEYSKGMADDSLLEEFEGLKWD